MATSIIRQNDEPFEPVDPEARRLPPPSVPQPTTAHRLADLQKAGLAGRVDAPEVPQPTVVERRTVTEVVELPPVEVPVDVAAVNAATQDTANPVEAADGREQPRPAATPTAPKSPPPADTAAAPTAPAKPQQRGSRG